MSITPAASLVPFRLGDNPIAQLPVGLGGSWFMPYANPSGEDANYLGAMEAAFEQGVTHFDTGATYGKGHSEELYGQFLRGKRDKVFIASKYDPPESTAEAMYGMIGESLRRLGVDKIDLYYIHWPRTGRDMRPVMEGLQRARDEGKVGAVGVSNFSVAEMAQVSEVARIDAHQLGYNLLWRYAEDEVIPWCRDHGVAVVTYSTLAHGILTGKFGRELALDPDDQRNRILPFRADIWPHVHAGVEQLKAIAAEVNRPLAHLALRWTLAQPAIALTIIGGRNAAQVRDTLPALEGDIPAGVFERMSAISDAVMQHMPHADNLFGRVG
ncbi:MAG: aldo/keto reductase [Hyphomicrobiales bacterium]|nr:MAG: aldo/keto reductase [Hyphomicrobiales bacterium]